MILAWVTAAAVFAGSLFLAGVFSGSETGMYCLNRLRVFLGMQQGDVRAARLGRLIDDEQGALYATLGATNVMNYVSTSAVAYMLGTLAGMDDVTVELYTIAILTPVVFVFGEVVPKNILRRHADALMPKLSGLLVSTYRVFRATGLTWCMKKVTAMAAYLSGIEAGAQLTIMPKRRIATLLQEALVGRHLGEDQSELVERVVRLSETPVRFVMVPHQRVVMISAHADRNGLVRLAHGTHHARVLVYGARRSQIVGLVKIDELLRDPTWTHVGERAVSALHLRPFDTVATAITRMQRVHKEMAVVTGFGGGLLGIVTLRDLLDEVVGEMTWSQV